MNYRNLYALLSVLENEIRNDRLKPEVQVVKLCLDYPSEGVTDNFLFWRFSQYKEALEYPELITLFQMGELVLGYPRNYNSFISGVVEEGFIGKANPYNPYKDLLTDDKTHEVLQQKISKLAAILKKELKEYYSDIRQLVGDAIFEEIRYDLNPRLGDLIEELYELLQNEVGNLIDKKMFLSDTRFEKPDEMRLLINIIRLTKHYGLTQELLNEISGYVRMGQFQNLFYLYKSLSANNFDLISINEALSVIENQDSESYNLNWINQMVELIRKIDLNYNELSEEEKVRYNEINDSSLFVIINGEEKFINKTDDIQISAEAIQRQLKLSMKRLESLGNDE